MKGLVFALLLGSMGVAYGQNIASLDPPLSRQEQKNLEDLRRQYQKAGYAAMTQEQEAQFIVKMRTKMAELMGNAMVAQQMGSHLSQMDAGTARSMATGLPGQRSGNAATTTTALPQVTAKELAAAVTARRASSAFTRFEPRKGGFLYNDRPLADTAGEIVQYGANPATGDVTYLVQVAPTLWQLKYSNVNAQLPPLLLGQVSSQGEVYTLQTVSGETSAGGYVIPTSLGAMVVRRGNLVDFDAVTGLKATALPEGFGVAELQQGDVAGTGFILLEREGDRSQANASPLLRLRQAKDALTSALKDTSHDYALFSPATGRTVALNVSAGGKKASFMDNCQRMNAVVNKCSSMDRRDSLWNQDGTRNDRHYYWTVYWFSTAEGPLAVARENISKEISVYQLGSDRRVTAFRRTLGIGYWSVEQTVTGSVQIKASWPFNKQPMIDDAATVFDSAFTTIQ